MSDVRKRSVTINGHRTSFSLEDPFYDIIIAIARQRQATLAQIIAEVDAERSPSSNLSSALRIHALEWVMNGPRAEK
ncbi:ribbon-helix-helix domain-containing protein [Phyllobacterium sp. 21LDTY02-6]|uniref:ribbon-helix-helix domain-containing protein n=1 Tax=unclassified Phyllobacterium TaxID=2638441 RepID=UPI002021B025|nr:MULTISPECIES: ribbon-helix-helix domain-containing protein [unclassified Phyllobacterium]MCO4316004.1 ribbon-helix-helix domain-containing protein [Phyllobacterium sp. 21LDTY02-6]MCX8279572.1 ribbon-helix-helix domain-containing protein [Phyllobacterium sp. 0TCS1.6C]MCX8292237.1 ribbon-helix-helix domain-containing protein [Phyllobacterium sp. 0TCS1.6A]